MMLSWLGSKVHEQTVETEWKFNSPKQTMNAALLPEQPIKLQHATKWRSRSRLYGNCSSNRSIGQYKTLRDYPNLRPVLWSTNSRHPVPNYLFINGSGFVFHVQIHCQFKFGNGSCHEWQENSLFCHTQERTWAVRYNKSRNVHERWCFRNCILWRPSKTKMTQDS